MGKGTIAGRYRLREQVGPAAWLADDEELGRLVEVRLLGPGGERFEPAARAAASLAHPHITRLFDYGESDGRRYLVAEHLPGGSLEERLGEGRPLPASEADRVARDVASALAYAHGSGIVHGGLAPASVHFDPEGRAKIVDFGADAAGRDVDATIATDVRAFGALAFTLLTGREPAGQSPLERLPSEASPALVAAIEAALSDEEEVRPADGAALVQLLGPPEPTVTTAEPVTQVLTAPALPARRRRTLLAGLAVAGLLGAGVAAAFLAGNEDGPGSTLPSVSVPRVSAATAVSSAATGSPPAATTGAPQPTSVERTTAPPPPVPASPPVTTMPEPTTAPPPPTEEVTTDTALPPTATEITEPPPAAP